MNLQLGRQPSVPALLLALLLAPAAQAERPLWYECQGMAFGYVLRQGDTIDFYNYAFNCPRLRITHSAVASVEKLSNPAARQEVLTVDNHGHEASCPYQVMTLTPSWFGDAEVGPPPFYSFAAYATLEQLEQERRGLGDGNFFSCSAYSIGINGVPQLIRPEGPHGRSIREQKRAIAAALRQARGARTGMPSGTRQQEPS
ncbi:hypothetical protein ACG0Z6_04100 [Roseateles sp. BYS180W]|uniref:Uncharacterized protein n=1 Tax=Roseateles rivi TaxID=3299028 RepID=A0ABW7FSX4_9BURK